MGLAPKFKEWVNAACGAAVVDAAPEASIVAVDGSCNVHAFRPSATDPQPPLVQLVDRVWSDMLGGTSDGATAILCFDHQGTTPPQKAKTQAARHKALKQWDPDQVAALLAEGRLPEEWSDFLADRTARGALFSAIAEAVLARFSGSADLGVLVLQNAFGSGGRVYGRAEDGRARLVADHPTPEQTGEADVALTAWVHHFAAITPDATVVVRTVDTDLVALLVKHGSPRTYVALHHYNPAHRLTLCVGLLRTALAATVKLSVDEFVVCAVLHGTDFVDRSSKGVPHWGKYLKACGQFLRHSGGRLVVENEAKRAVLNSTVAHRMLSYAAKVSRWDADHLRALAWNVDYWLAEPARVIKAVVREPERGDPALEPEPERGEAVLEPEPEPERGDPALEPEPERGEPALEPEPERGETALEPEPECSDRSVIAVIDSVSA